VGAALALTAVASLVFLLMAAAFRDPAFVDRVRIDNRSGYDVHVDVAAGAGQSRLPLGVAAQQCTTAFDDVLDAGPTWVVRFTTQGRDGGAIAVSRAQLEQNGWTLRVPDDVVDRFRAAGAPPAPRHSCAPA